MGALNFIVPLPCFSGNFPSALWIVVTLTFGRDNAVCLKHCRQYRRRFMRWRGNGNQVYEISDLITVAIVVFCLCLQKPVNKTGVFELMHSMIVQMQFVAW